MGWSIGVLENSVKINKKCATELKNRENELECSAYSPTENGELCFDVDEGADWLSNGPALEILERHGAAGEVLFGSVEGDDAGDFWGYRFVAGQKTIRLQGSLVWAVKSPKPVRKKSTSKNKG